MKNLLKLFLAFSLFCSTVKAGESGIFYPPQTTELTVFVVGALTQQLVYELFHEGFHFDKFDALLFSTVLVGVGGGLYWSMDANPPSMRTISRNWMGQALSIGVTIAIPGL